MIDRSDKSTNETAQERLSIDSYFVDALFSALAKVGLGNI
jgi:hypothetical protein